MESARVASGERQWEKAAGRADARGPSIDQLLNQREVDVPSPGTTRVIDWYRGSRDSKWHQDGVGTAARGHR
jgi:hypothetical protein